VLLVGEPGVGKEHVAAAIHGRSPRSVGPFVAVRCAALSETWLESELFGHEAPGASRRPGKLEAARGGTVFLDELAALPPRCQKRLSRAMDLGFLEKAAGGRIPLDARLIVSSCHDLASMVQAGAMREDLYRRLAGQTVIVPPLRERGGDVVALAERFLYQLAAEAGQRRSGFAGEAATRLAHHPWPSNVRELRNVVERIVLSGGDDPVSAADVERALRR
jgi:DNA-binding NtrC family response regulator